MSKKSFRKLICVLLLIVMCVPSLQGLADETEIPVFTMAGLDETQYRGWNDNRFFVSMQERTGVGFTFRQYDNQDKWTQAKKDYLKEGADLPDVLFKAALTLDEMQAMHDAGVLIDLKPYLESCCPNLWAILTEHPDYLDRISLSDGAVVALPFITDIPTQNYMWINTTFLSNVYRQIPNTMDELYDVLTAFKNQDANKNGNPSDEIPMGFLGSFDLKFLAHGFGLIANDYNIFVKDGKVAYMPLEENFPAFIEWCVKAYAEGLLDKSGFSTSDVLRQVTDEKSVQVYGMLLAPNISTILPAAWQSDYTVLAPMEYEGARVYRGFADYLINGTFAVTKTCRDPETVLAWVDRLYAEEDAVLMSIGRENIDFIVNEDGTWQFTENVTGNNYYSITDLITSAAACPGVSVNDFQRRYYDGEITRIVDELRQFDAYCVKPFPAYALSGQMKQKISSLQNVLGMITDEQIARWVLGEEAFTAESYQAYCDTLEANGLDEFLSLWQEIYDSIK